MSCWITWGFHCLEQALNREAYLRASSLWQSSSSNKIADVTLFSSSCTMLLYVFEHITVCDLISLNLRWEIFIHLNNLCNFLKTDAGKAGSYTLWLDISATPILSNHKVSHHMSSVFTFNREDILGLPVKWVDCCNFSSNWIYLEHLITRSG